MKELSNLFNATELHKVDKLKHFYSTLSQNVLALLAVGKTYDGPSTFLVHNLTKVLPRAMQIQFLDLYEDIKKDNDNRSELEFFFFFLERQVRIQSKITNNNSKPQQNKQPNNFVAHKKGHGLNRSDKPSQNSHSLNFNSTAENTSANNSTRQTHVCVFCEGSHLSENCKEPLTLV